MQGGEGKRETDRETWEEIHAEAEMEAGFNVICAHEKSRSPVEPGALNVGSRARTRKGRTMDDKNVMGGFCPNCGAATQPGGAFCGNCGTKLAALEPEPAQPVMEPAAQPAQPAQPEQAIAQPTFEQPVMQPQQPAAEPVAQPVFGGQQPAAAPAQPDFGGAPIPQPFGAQPAQPQQPFGGTPTQQPFGGAPASPMNYQQPKQPGGVGALVCGILAILFGLLSPIIGVILGIVAIVLAKKGGDKAKIGRICGIAGIVVSAAMFVIGMVIGVAAVDEILDEGLDSSSTPVLSDEKSSSSLSGASIAGNYNIDPDLYVDPEAKAVVEETAELFEKVETGDSAMIQEIADIADEGFYSELEFHMSDCGYSSVDYARGMTAGFSYEVENVVLNTDEGTGWIGVNVDAKDVFAVLEAFNNDIDALDASGKAAGMTEAQIKAEFGSMLSDAVNSADVTEDVNYAIIDIELVDGAWKVDLDSWDFELDYMFGLV